MRLGNIDRPHPATGGPKRNSRAGMSLIEIMISAAILMIFAGSIIVGMTMLNGMAVTTRNQTQARAIINEEINRMLSIPYYTTYNVPPWNGTAVTQNRDLWEYKKGAQTSKMTGTLTTRVTADAGGSGTCRITVEFRYVFRGRNVVLSTTTIRGSDA